MKFEKFQKECTKLLCLNRDRAHRFVQCVSPYVLLVSCSFSFEYLLCFVRGQSQRTKEIENKNL